MLLGIFFSWELGLTFKYTLRKAGLTFGSIHFQIFATHITFESKNKVENILMRQLNYWVKVANV